MEGGGKGAGEGEGTGESRGAAGGTGSGMRAWGKICPETYVCIQLATIKSSFFLSFLARTEISCIKKCAFESRQERPPARPLPLAPHRPCGRIHHEAGRPNFPEAPTGGAPALAAGRGVGLCGRPRLPLPLPPHPSSLPLSAPSSLRTEPCPLPLSRPVRPRPGEATGRADAPPHPRGGHDICGTLPLTATLQGGWCAQGARQ